MANVLERWTGHGRHQEPQLTFDNLIVEPADTYHSKRGEYLASHRLAEFRANPVLFRRKELGLIRDEERPAFLIGRAAHTLVLEGREVFESEFAVGGPINPRTGKTYGMGTQKFERWAAEVGKPVISDDQAALIERMALSVREHPLAPSYLDAGVAERVGRCELRGVPCQARFDWLHPEKGLIDYKTSDDLSVFGFCARSYGYLHQMAFYRSVLRAVTGVTVPVHLIATEKREPYRCGVWRIADAVLDQAEKDNDEAIDRLAKCRAEDVWPTGFEDLQTIDYL